MRIFPPTIEIGEKEGFSPEKDIFKRADFGKGLADLVRLVEDPLVIVLDGPWGSGKTTHKDVGGTPSSDRPSGCLLRCIR
jgi:hypothetical protein